MRISDAYNSLENCPIIAAVHEDKFLSSLESPAEIIFLLEGNVFEMTRTGTVFKIADVNDLYMINNKIINHGVNTSENMPITVKNSVISLVDGITFEYDNNGVEYGLNIAGCEYQDSNIKNLNILNNNTMKAYKDWWK